MHRRFFRDRVVDPLSHRRFSGVLIELENLGLVESNTSSNGRRAIIEKVNGNWFRIYSVLTEVSIHFFTIWSFRCTLNRIFSFPTMCDNIKSSPGRRFSNSAAPLATKMRRPWSTVSFARITSSRGIPDIYTLVFLNSHITSFWPYNLSRMI